MKAHVRTCDRCAAICETELCALCNDERRRNGQICVIEQATDLFATIAEWVGSRATAADSVSFTPQLAALRGTAVSATAAGPVALPAGTAKQSEIIATFTLPKVAATLSVTVGHGKPPPPPPGFG